MGGDAPAAAPPGEGGSGHRRVALAVVAVLLLGVMWFDRREVGTHRRTAPAAQLRGGTTSELSTAASTTGPPEPETTTAAPPLSVPAAKFHVGVCFIGHVRSFQVPWVRDNIRATVFNADPDAAYDVFALLTLVDEPRRGTRAAPTPKPADVKRWLAEVAPEPASRVVEVRFTERLSRAALHGARCNDSATGERSITGQAATLVFRYAVIGSCYWDMLIPHEARRATPYTHVMRLRPDVAYAVPLPLFVRYDVSSITVSAHHAALSDHMWVAPRALGPAAFGGIEYLCDTLDRDALRSLVAQGYAPERVLAARWGLNNTPVVAERRIAILLTRYWDGIECGRLRMVVNGTPVHALRAFDCGAANADYIGSREAVLAQAQRAAAPRVRASGPQRQRGGTTFAERREVSEDA